MNWRNLLILVLWTLLATALGTKDPIEQMRDLLDRGYYNSAVQLNGPALVVNFPDDPEAHYLFAYALYLTGRLTESRRALNLAIALQEGTDPRLDHLNGLLAATEGNSKTALTLLRTVSNGAGSYTYAMDWGRIAWQLGSYEEAIKAYTKAASTQRGRTEPWPELNRGRLLSFLGRYIEAIEAFHTSITVFEDNDLREPRPSPAYVEAYFRLGEAYENLDDLNEANVHYWSAHFADPTYGPALHAIERLTQETNPPTDH
jgi:tetratricopeptide (TPR) repeat protein